MQQLSPSDLSILLVEPSAVQRKVITNHLSEESISNVIEASSVQDALKLLETHKPDLVASAFHFEDGTALELILKIREHDVWQDIPFMLVSSETRKSQLEEFKQSGIIAILPKPFTKDDLARAINATLDTLSPEELDLSFFDVQDVRVLVVDDSRLARNHITRVLNNLGISKIDTAEDGKSAIDVLQDSMFDLVVTDYNMPEVNGRELTEYIRTESHQSHVPVLMVSSEASETHLSNIEQAGVNAMCDKPFEPTIVKQLIYRLLEQDAD